MVVDEQKGDEPTQQIESHRHSDAHVIVDKEFQASNDSSIASNPVDRTTQAEQGIPSNLSPGPTPIPRSERRGLFGGFTIIPEVTNPHDYSNGTKWIMTVIASLAATTSSTGSSIFYPALDEMARELHSSSTVTNLSIAFYMLAMAFTPLWWSYFSELHGRRTVYFLSFFLFVIFSCIAAVSVDIAMLIVFRVLSGGAAASVQSVGAGTISDIWEPKLRGRAMGIFYLGPLCGPGLAPIIGGALTEGLGWRSTLWFLAIFGGVMFLMIFFCLPETIKRSPADSNFRKIPSSKMVTVINGIFAPFKVLTLLRHPPVIVSVFSASIAFSVLYVLNISIQSVFGNDPYNFTAIEIGLLYLSPTLGYAVSSTLGGRWIDYIMAREARKAGRYDDEGKPKFLPEDRLKENIWIASCLYPCALIWYGWTAEKHIFWFVPCLASFFVGIGLMLVFGAVTTVLTEFTPKRSSSGVAVNNFLRNILACIAAVVTQPLIDAMGSGWMCTMVGLFTLVTGLLSIFSIARWGPQWRDAMNKKLNG